jgi:transposase, IS30 family
MKKPRKYCQLDDFARDRIEALLRSGHKKVEISQVLGVHKSTISREMRRSRKDGRYCAKTASHKARVKRCHSKYQGMRVESLPATTVNWIIEQLKNKRSPDEIAGRMRECQMEPRVSKDAIYHWLYSVWGQKYCQYLCTRRYRKKPQREKIKREMIPNRRGLAERPVGSNLIHAQVDTFVSPKKFKTTASAVLIVEKSSKLIRGGRIPNLKPSVMAQAVRESMYDLTLDTLTGDNGIENRNHEDFGVPTYFCDPHAPWQKPLVEQSIGLLRRWFIPKGTDLRCVSDEKLQKYMNIINNKWRRSLNYKSALEVAEGRGIIKRKSLLVNVSNVLSKVALEVRI